MSTRKFKPWVVWQSMNPGKRSEVLSLVWGPGLTEIVQHETELPWGKLMPSTQRALAAMFRDKNEGFIRPDRPALIQDTQLLAPKKARRQNAERIPAKKGRSQAEIVEMRRANTRNFRENNPDGQLSHELKKYGVTVEWYRAQEAIQRKLCAVCGLPERAKRGGKVKRLAVDHDHATGRARALVCQMCNMHLAWLEDVTWRPQADAYLAKYTYSRISDSTISVATPIHAMSSI